MPNEKINFRDWAIDLLKTLSSEKEQINYQKNVPHVYVPDELICQWFDDFYACIHHKTPGNSGYERQWFIMSPHEWDKAAEEFKSNFSENELERQIQKDIVMRDKERNFNIKLDYGSRGAVD